MNNDLTNAERSLIATLPKPPKLANTHTSNIWIIEWLPANEPHTGRSLHEWIWMKDRRPGWSAYFSCKSKTEVIAAIAHATEHALRSKMTPILHLEAHGGDMGLEGPDGKGSAQLLTWDELTDPLQQLNLATRCNLVVVVAACTGIAGIKALRRGPRAPAVALVGPDRSVSPSNLLWGTKEIYRRWMDKNPILANIAESASREAGTVVFERMPFATLAYDSLVEELVRSMRPTEILERKKRGPKCMLAETDFSSSEIEHRIARLPLLLPWEGLQQDWDKMFMIDIEPNNRERFSLDLRTIVDRITAIHK